MYTKANIRKSIREIVASNMTLSIRGNLQSVIIFSDERILRLDQNLGNGHNTTFWESTRPQLSCKYIFCDLKIMFFNYFVLITYAIRPLRTVSTKYRIHFFQICIPWQVGYQIARKNCANNYPFAEEPKNAKKCTQLSTTFLLQKICTLLHYIFVEYKSCIPLASTV